MFSCIAYYCNVWCCVWQHYNKRILMMMMMMMKLCLYLVPFLRYSTSKNGVTLKLGGRGRSRSLKIAPFYRPYTTFYWSAIVYICYRFWAIWRWKMSWPWNLGYRSLNVILTGTIRKLGCGFLFAFHSNYGSILHQFRDKNPILVENRNFSYSPCIRRPR